jgi:2-keto-4-pentenoate hydratase
MTSNQSAAAVAQALLAARRDRAPIPSTLVTASLATAEDAYAAQDLVLREIAPDTAARPRWWKSGGPSREATLTHAPLPAAGVWASPAAAGDWHFNVRLIEAEIALRLASDVTPARAAALTPESARELVDAMAVTIEVVDSRWQQFAAAPALLKLADLQSHGALAVGAWVPYVARDWSAQGCSVTIGSNPAREFRGTHALGDPAWLLPTWLRHATRHGATVPAGTGVTTGTWCGMLPAQHGDLVTVRFAGVGETSVQL